MNYLAEIKAFYDWLECNPLEATHISLWHGLMSIANKTGWREEFTVPMSTLEFKTGIKRTNLYKVRNKLQQLGLISFKERDGRQSAVYKMLSLCTPREHNSDERVTDERQTSDTTVTCEYSINKLNKTKQSDMSETSSDGSESDEIEKVLGGGRVQINTDMYFELIYSEYPKKEGKKDAKQAYIQFLTKGRRFKGFPDMKLNHAQIRVAVQEYVKSKYGTETQYFPMFSTFMNTGIVDYINGEEKDHFNRCYEAAMSDKYGESWRNIKFKYTGMGIGK